MALPCNNLNLNLYRIFYVVAKTKSFSESSRVLHISQPAISKHVQNLEYELDTLLFYRTNRGIELTEEAKNLLIYVEKAYNYLALGERELEESKELTRGKITIGISNYMTTRYLDVYLKEFMKEHPNLSVEIVNNTDRRLMEMFNQHTIDLLILNSNVRKNKEYKIVELVKEPYAFSYSKRLPYEVSTLEEIITKPLIVPTNNTKTRKDLEMYLSNHDLIINPSMELDDEKLVLSYTKEDLGIGYLPKSVIIANPDLELVEIDGLPESIINLVYHENALSNASKAFITLLTNENMITKTNE